MKKAKKIAFAAIFSSLGTVVILLGSLVDVLDISAAFLASLCVLLILCEFGIAWAAGTYAVISILSLIIVPGSRLAGILFAIIFGLLPITKMLFEKLGAKTHVFVAYLCKIALFNGEMIALWLVAKALLEIPEKTWLLILCAVLANAIFILADIFYGVLTRIYYRNIRNKISKFLK